MQFLPFHHRQAAALGFGSDLLKSSALSVVRAGDTATYIDSKGRLHDAPANTPRFDYSNPNGGGLLIEAGVTVEGRSGEDLRANTEGNPLSAWSATTTIATRGFAAPDGSTDATKIEASGGNTAHARSAASLTASGAGQTHAICLLAKAAELDTVTFGFVSGGGYSFATFTLSGAGSVGTPLNATNWSGGVGHIRHIGGGVYFIHYAAVNSGTSVAARIYPGTNLSYDNDGAGVIAWGFDIALNSSYVGSYVRNADLQVTRAADDVSLLLADLPQWSPAEGTFLIDFVAGASVASRYLFDIHDGTASNRLRVFTTSLGTLGLWVTVGGTAHTQIYSGGNIVPLTRNKVAVSFKDDEFYISVNGSSVGSNLSGTVPVVDRIQFGANLSKTASTFLNGHLPLAAYRPVALGAGVEQLAAA